MKDAILITSRVHSGEVQSSFCLEGFVDFILSEHPKAIELRQRFIFYIVPMINIDGVI
jgi:murein tripeptide amidase MpaA